MHLAWWCQRQLAAGAGAPPAQDHMSLDHGLLQPRHPDPLFAGPTRSPSARSPLLAADGHPAQPLYWLSAIDPAAPTGDPNSAEPGFLPLQQFGWRIMPEKPEDAGSVREGTRTSGSG